MEGSSVKALARIMDAVRSGECNTTQDIADVCGMTIESASAQISELIQMGLLRRNGRVIPNNNPSGGGRPFQVFELA